MALFTGFKGDEFAVLIEELSVVGVRLHGMKPCRVVV